jgi:hypothetical protein
VDSPDKFNETWKYENLSGKQLDLSQDFFVVSLLIVCFPMTQIKYKIFDL